MKTPINNFIEENTESRFDITLDFHAVENGVDYIVEFVEEFRILDIVKPIKQKMTIVGVDSLKVLIERCRTLARKSNRNLIIKDLESNSIYTSFVDVDNLVQDCIDRQRVLRYNYKLRKNTKSRLPNYEKVKKIDMRIFENGRTERKSDTRVCFKPTAKGKYLQGFGRNSEVLDK